MDFDDVAEGNWYSEAIRWAASEGIASGYGDGAFGTNDPIIREQLTAMLYRVTPSTGDMTSRSVRTSTSSPALDVTDVS